MVYPSFPSSLTAPAGARWRRGAALAAAAVSFWLLNQPATTFAASLFSASDASASSVANDPNSVELGVKFQASQTGTVSAIRFYKGPHDRAPHVGHLWSASGQLLSSVTFSNETASGWQQATLTKPVAIQAGTTYVVSYHSNGYYPNNVNYFSGARTVGVLTAPASTASAGNGVYAYGSSSAFPMNSWQASNYWVDIVFNPSTSGTPTPAPTPTPTPAPSPTPTPTPTPSPAPKSGPTVTAKSGNPVDVQAAINSAASGTVVVIPNGSYNWSSGVTLDGTKALTLTAATSGGVTITDNTIGTAVMMNEATQGPVVLSGIHFVAGSTSDPNGASEFVAMYGNTGNPCVIHDCTFMTSSYMGEAIRIGSIGGLVYKCTFNTSWGYPATPIAVAFKNDEDPTSWGMPLTLGARDVNGTTNQYLEDCTFTDYTLDVCDVDGGGRAVIRHNTFNDSGLGSHGAETGPMGARSAEAYNNTFVFHTSGTSPNGFAYPASLNWWFFIRGGVWYIHDNVMPNIVSQMWGDKAEILLTDFNIRRTSPFVACQTQYPSYRQAGQDSNDGKTYFTTACAFWGDTGGGSDSPSLEDYGTDECGNGQTVFGSSVSPVYLQNGRDYVVGAAPAGYTPYTYPHPLRAKIAN